MLIERFWKQSRAKRGMWHVGPPLNKRTIRRLLTFDRLLTLGCGHGAIVECGVGGGDSLVMLQGLLHARHVHRYSPQIRAFDTFRGLPEPHAIDNPHATRGQFAYSKDYIEKLLRARVEYLGWGDSENRLNCWMPKLIQGEFFQTLGQAPHQIAFLHLDCNLYRSYRTCFEMLTAKLLPQSIIVLDDYDPRGKHWPGAKHAIEEWCALNGWTVQDDPVGAVYFIQVP